MGPGAFQYRSYQSILKGEAILAPACMALRRVSYHHRSGRFFRVKDK